MCSCSSPARPRSGMPRMPCERHIRLARLPSRCFRCTEGCPPPSSTACSSRAASPASDAASSSPRTSRRRASPSPASSTSSTPAPRASRGTATARRCSDCRSNPSRKRRPTNARVEQAARATASPSASTAKTTSRSVRSSPNPRCCARLSPLLCCRCSHSGSVTSPRSRSSHHLIRAASRRRSICSPSWGRSI